MSSAVGAQSTAASCFGERLRFVFLAVFLATGVNACAPVETGHAGERCVFEDSEERGDDGCDAHSVCSSGVCRELCSHPGTVCADGQLCQTFTRVFDDWKYSACYGQPPTTSGGSGQPGTGGGTLPGAPPNAACIVSCPGGAAGTCANQNVCGDRVQCFGVCCPRGSWRVGSLCYPSKEAACSAAPEVCPQACSRCN